MKTPLIFRCVLVFSSAVSLTNAATLIEDFSYTSGSLATKGTTGGGWSGSWGIGGSTSRVVADSASNLSYSAGGYSISQTGNGFAYGNFNSFRGVNRVVSPALSGTVWFSYLVENNDANDRTGFMLNHNDHGSNLDYFSGTNYRVELSGTSLSAFYGSSGSPTVIADSMSTTFALNTTHLVLGSITVGTGNDTLSVWMNPADINNLPAPNLTTSAIDIGNTFSEAGIYGYNPDAGTGLVEHGGIDALRISDGGGDSNAAFAAVTVPEPSSIALVFGGLSLLLIRRRAYS